MLSKYAWFFRQFLAFSILKANPTLRNLIIFFLVDKEEFLSNRHHNLIGN